MLKKTMTYTDYNGVERTEDFYFNLSETELMEMEMGVEGGLTERLQKIVNSKSGPLIMSTFKDLILRSYGEKSEDGRHFNKSEEISRGFEHSEAYNKLFMEMMQDNTLALKFIKEIMPAKLVEQMNKMDNNSISALANK